MERSVTGVDVGDWRRKLMRRQSDGALCRGAALPEEGVKRTR
jgi:hypothetical protein